MPSTKTAPYPATASTRTPGGAETGALPRPNGHFATIFETDAWRQYVEATRNARYAPRHLTLTSTRQVTIASYLVERRFGRWEVLYSIPPYYYGSLQSDGPLTPADLTDLAQQLRQASDLHSLTMAIHPLDGCAAACEAAWQPYVLTQTATHILELTSETGMSAELIGSRNQRKKVQKALRRGVTVTRADDRRAVELYYPIYLSSAKRWGLKEVEPFEALLGLQQHLAPYYTLWLAWCARQVIGALMVLSYGDTAWTIHGCSLATYWERFPNNLLYSTALAAARIEGRRYFDFLPSNRLPGVEAFKESLGAQRRPYCVYRIPNVWYAALSGLKHRWFERPDSAAERAQP